MSKRTSARMTIDPILAVPSTVLPLDTVLVQGGYVCGLDPKLTPYASCKGSERAGDIIVLVSFDEDTNHDEPERHIRSEGLIPASAYVLAYIGAALPQMNVTRPIVALGTKFHLDYFPDMERCFMIRQESWGRLFTVCPLGGTWGADYRFLACTPARHH